jgi:predicted TPR repeat methyltransferase
MTAFDSILDDREAASARRAPAAGASGHFRPSRRSDVAAAARNLHAAVALHRHGKLREAERLYRAVLEVNESDFDCLHDLGLLHAQEGRFQDAVGLLRAGARQDPRSVEAHNNLANVLALLNRHDEAVAGFRIAIALKPDFAEAHNNLGNALVKQGHGEEAIAHYARALELRPSYADAHVNLGDILRQRGEAADALAHYRQALAISPGVAEIHCRVGDVLRSQGRADEAAACYRSAIALRPGFAPAHCKLAAALLDRRELGAATASFERALALEPGSPDAWLGLGQVFHQARRCDEALAAFARAPDHLAQAWLGRARSLRRLGRAAEAIVAYRQALARGGDAEVIRYYLASLGAETTPTAAPRQLVSTIFDQYSDHYDQHVVGALQYRTPDLLFDAVMRVAPGRAVDMLDLGCGTGLLGACLRPHGRTLTGVDISPNMLERARRRRIYDHLACRDLLEFLRTRAAEFDLTLAADVLVYIGDLAEVFREVRRTLREGGRFGFSVEAGEERDFELRPTLRYAHSAGYLRRLAHDHGFVVEAVETAVLRQEDGNDVIGHLAVLRRA